MFSFLFEIFSRLDARFKRAERLRIRRLETDLSQAKLALAFYSHQENYPAFVMRGQRTGVLGDAGSRARQTLRSLRLAIPGRSIDVKLSLAEAQDALRALPGGHLLQHPVEKTMEVEPA